MRIVAILSCVAALSASPCVFAAQVKASTSQKRTQTFTRGAPLPKWAKPSPAIPPTTSTGPIVLRLAEIQAWTGPKPTVLVTRAIQVNEKARLAEIGQYQLNYSPAYQKLYLHRLAILRGNEVIDRTSTVDVRAIEREPSLENGFYDGEATVSLLLQDVRVGDTLLITYSIEGRNPVFGDTWSGEFMWDGPSPIEVRRIMVTHPIGRPLHWRELGDATAPSLQPVVEREGAVERLVFEGRALQAVEAEPSMPPDFLAARLIQLSEYASWHEVATWAGDLFKRTKDSKEVAEVARQFEKLDSQEARASAALHWVQDEIRYFSVALGENSHRPQAPQVVLKRRYGDCKDKSNLLIALLDRLDIKAEPVLVNSGAQTLPQRLLPTTSWFDHVVVRIHADGKAFYADPTRESEKGTLSSLPIALGGAAGLVASRTSDALMSIPEDVTVHPDITRSEKVDIASMDGDAVLETRISYRGHYARYMRKLYQSSTLKQRRNNLLSDYEKQFNGIALLADPDGDDIDGGAGFEVVARFTLPKPVKKADGWYSIDHDSKILEGSLGIPDKLVRRYPFSLPLGKYHGRYTLQLVWPKVVRQDMLDDASGIENDVFRAHKEFSWRDNVVNYVVDYEIKRKQIGANELSDLDAQSKLLDLYAKSSLRVNEVWLTDPRAATLSDRQTSAFRMLVYNSALAGQASSVKDGATFGQLCKALQNMPILEELYPISTAKMGDVLLKRARAAALNETDLDKCSLTVGFRSGSFDAVLANQDKLAIKDEDPLTLQAAWINVAKGNLVVATVDAMRFASARLKSHTLAPADAAMVVAILKRAGGEIPEILRDYAARNAADVWPRPVLAYQLGTLTQEQLMLKVEQLPQGARDLALNEMWFYIGQHALQEGRRQLALQAFRWVRLHSPRDLIQYQLALAELNNIEWSDPDYLKAVDAWSEKQYAIGTELFEKAAHRGVAAAEQKLARHLEEGTGVAKDVNLAVEHYRKAAELGDLDAMNDLAITYSHGDGIAKDLDKAIFWFERAAQSGHVHASKNIGERYFFGSGGAKRDYVMAAKYLGDAAELGNIHAQSRLSQMYADGYGIESDDAQALYWSGQAAEHNDSNGMAILASLFAYGQGVPEDIPQAIRLFRVAADKGSSSAQAHLGYAYKIGRGVEKNPREALRWNLMAAHENPSAKTEVGLAYLYGDGTSADIDEAVKYLSDDKPSDAAAVCRGLISAYDKSRSTTAEWQKALALIRLRAQQGDPVCQANLGVAFQFGKGVSVDEKEAVVWYTRAADSGIPIALNNLADQYERGGGVAQDLTRAVNLYRQAAKKGYAPAMYSLGLLFEEGKGLKADPYLASAYFALAREYKFPDAAAAFERVVKKLPVEAANRANSFAVAWEESKPLPDETK